MYSFSEIIVFSFLPAIISMWGNKLIWHWNLNAVFSVEAQRKTYKLEGFPELLYQPRIGLMAHWGKLYFDYPVIKLLSFCPYHFQCFSAAFHITMGERMDNFSCLLFFHWLLLSLRRRYYIQFVNYGFSTYSWSSQLSDSTIEQDFFQVPPKHWDDNVSQILL